MKPRFFKAAPDFNKWLAKNHAKAEELWVGYYKKGTGKPSITWPESVQEALCYGWIDGIRRSIDEERYMIRFTPRRPRSTWSAINLKYVKELMAEGRMRPAGIRSFEARKADNSEVYSYENRKELDSAYVKKLKAIKKAWAFFQAQPPGYRKTAGHWVMAAKRESTRLRRLETLIADSAAELRIGPLRRRKG